MTLFIDKITYDFASLRVSGRCGISFLDECLGGNSETICFSSSYSALPPNEIYLSFCLLSAVAPFHKRCDILECMPGS